MMNTSLLLYLFQQAKGQFNIIINTQKVGTIMANGTLDANELNKIKLIQEVKVFAEKQFGLKKTTNYNTFYNQNHAPILWMLTACEPLSFKERVWNFPMLGEVSYKGFFKHELALKEAIPLKLQHYDVDIGKVSAWSTLGILSDPILSSMLENDEGALAELIIHELTHATLYFADNVDFNENFASFVGQQGALLFIAHKYGNNSMQMNNYLYQINQENILKSFLLKQKEALESFYNTLDLNLNYEEKIKLKQQKLDEIISKLFALNIYNWKTKIKIAKRIRISGNAYFMSYNRYDAQYDQLLSGFKKQNSNLKLFINYSKLKMQSGK